MTYAVIVTGGQQFKVAAGDTLKIEKLPIAVGEEYTFDTIVMLSNGEQVQIGTPYVQGAKVTATVLRQGRGEKIRIIKFRRRKHHCKRMGHRQSFTEVKINQISA